MLCEAVAAGVIMVVWGSGGLRDCLGDYVVFYVKLHWARKEVRSHVASS
jgi:hypothetical protein